MKLAKRHILGLSIDERSISVAQVAVTGKRPTVQRLARMELAGGLSIERPEILGEKLRGFLAEHHLVAHAAVVGVPARWVLTQDRELPPTDEAAAIAMLRLQTERMAEEPMSFDVAGALAGSAARRVMLVGILQRQLDRIGAMCRAAQLRLEGVTPTVMAVARVVPAEGRPLLVYGETSAEVVWQREGSPLVVKHLAADAGETGPAVAAVAMELRRALLLRPGSEAPPGAFLMWNGSGLNDRELGELGERSGLTPQRVQPLEAGDMLVSAQAMNGEAGRRPVDAWLPAIAVALTAGAGNGNPPVNLLRPRLVEPKTGRFSRQTILMAAAVVAVVVGLVALYITTTTREAEAAALNERLKAMEPEVKAAEASLERFAYGRTYFQPQRPAVLDCLREMAAAFGTDSSIWAMSFSLRDNQKGVLQGRASNQPAVFALRDKLQRNPRFANLSAEIREATGAQRDVAFTLTFTYNAREQS